ncbi:unnamed protein product, partial [Darwinula stevensoni]
KQTAREMLQMTPDSSSDGVCHAPPQPSSALLSPPQPSSALLNPPQPSSTLLSPPRAIISWRASDENEYEACAWQGRLRRRALEKVPQNKGGGREGEREEGGGRAEVDCVGVGEKGVGRVNRGGRGKLGAGLIPLGSPPPRPGNGEDALKDDVLKDILFLGQDGKSLVCNCPAQLGKSSHQVSGEGEMRLEETYSQLDSFYEFPVKFPPPPPRTHPQGSVRSVSIMDTLSEMTSGDVTTLATQLLPTQQPQRHRRGSKETTQVAAQVHSRPPRKRVVSPKRVSPERDRARRRKTPEWIRKIFQFARNGDLRSLENELRDLHPTLVSSLRDSRGNSLVHTLAAAGDVTPLQRLIGGDGARSSALLNANKAGLTPIVLAIKHGHVDVVQWLLENSNNVELREGGRSLLHWAAKYGQYEVLCWLLRSLPPEDVEMMINSVDENGNTVVHLAARSGNISLLMTLLQRGEPSLCLLTKNKRGLTPVEVANIAGHGDCAHYLNIYEAGLRACQDALRLQDTCHSMSTNTQELHRTCREMITIGKRLEGEREELVQQLQQLRQHVMDLHERMIVEIQLLLRENQRLGGTPQHSQEELQSLVEACADLHRDWEKEEARWSQPGSLRDLQRKLSLVEEQLRVSTSAASLHPNQKKRQPLHFVKYVVRNGIVTFGIGDQASGSSSRLNGMKFGFSRMNRSTSESSLDSYTSLYELETEDDNHQRSGYWTDGIYASTPIKTRSAMKSKCTSDLEDEVQSSGKRGKPKHGPKPVKGIMPLKSKSGTCTVLEVIEPGSEEENEELDLSVLVKETPTRQEECPVQQTCETAGNSNTGAQKSVKHLVSRFESKSSTEPDLILGTKTHKGLGENSDSPPDALSRLADESSLGGSVTEGLGLADVEQQMLPLDLAQSSMCLTGSSNSDNSSAASSSKKRGFLQKLKGRWPSRRKVSSTPSGKITPEDFRETYTVRDVGSSSSQEDDLFKQPESTTSNPQSLDTSKRKTNPLNVVVEDLSATEKEVCPSSPNQDDIRVEKLPAENKPPPLPSSPPPLEDDVEEKSLPRMALLAKSTPDLKSHGGIEAMSVTTSEDSGIVARPSSSASKSDSLSRPGSTSSSYLPFKGFPLRKASSVSTDLLPTPDSSTAGGRLSPAPSEVSKTESALSPPSQASDVSKTESTRHLNQLGRIEEITPTGEERTTKPVQMTRKKPEMLKVTIMEDKKPEKKSKEEMKAKRRIEKPWYEVSDDESDLPSPSSLSCLITARTSSGSEDEADPLRA